MEKGGNHRTIEGILLILLYPFLGIIYTFRQIRLAEAEKWFWLICVYFGLALIYFDYTSTVFVGEGKDAERYALEVISLHGSDIGFVDYLKDYNERKQDNDYYAAILLYFVTRFSGNPQLFFGLAALIMGLFFAKTAWIIINRTQKSQYIFILIMTMLLASPIWKINGVRWWTALYVFLYGLLSFLFDKNPKKLIWCILALLIHFTFLFAIYAVVAWLLLPKRKLTPYVVVFIVLNLMSSFDLSSWANWIARLIPSFYNEEKIIGFMTYEYAASHNWFADSGRYVAIYTNFYLVLVSFFKGGDIIKKDELLRKFFILVLVVSSVCLFINFAPWGRRFLDLSNFLSFAWYCYAFSIPEFRERTKKLFAVAMPFLLYFVLFQISKGLYSIGLYNLFFGNFITVFLYNDNIPVHFYLDKLF